MLGKCAYIECPDEDEEDVAVASCSSCKKPVHHMCSNNVHEGELNVRVCSYDCCVKLGLKSLSSESAPMSVAIPTAANAKRKITGANIEARSKTDKWSARKRSKPTRSDSSSNKDTRRSTSKKGKQKGRTASSGDMSANTNVPTEYTDVVAVGVSAVAAQASRSEASSGDEGDFQGSAKKKFYFTIEKDLDLLREILSARPYAAKHGTVTTRYHDVATNLNEYWVTELAMRTVKERFFLLVKELKSSDMEYRKKSGVAENYTEIKQCLQDITEEMRDLAELKMKKKSDKKSKQDRLVSAGERLREQATKRRSS